jgi:AraC-like DNA-binding protein
VQIRREPAPALRRFVQRYWSYAEQMRGAVHRDELPLADVVLILSFGPELRVDAERRTSFVAGLTESPVATDMDGVSDGMQVNLTPLGARMLLGVPMVDVTNTSVALDDLLGRAGAELVDRLHEAPVPERFALLDRFIAVRLADAAPPTPSVAWSWRRLVASDGRVSVRELTDELGCSRKHLVTRFREQVGLPPKAAALILRFQRALRLAAAEPARSWGEIALACGYYDQSHFNRDFRRLAGTTPTEYRARQLAG